MRADIEEFARRAGVRPHDGEALPWSAATAEVGLELPPDYRAFVDAFGSGDLYGRLGVNTPWPLRDPTAGAAPLRAFVTDATKTCDLLRGLRADYPQAFPYAFYPEPAGLLPWAAGIGGELCFWLTGSTGPATWPVLAWDKSEWHRYAPGMLRTLLLTITGADAFLRDLFHDPSAPTWTPRT